MGDDDSVAATPKRKSKKSTEGRGVPVFAPLPPLHSRERETKNSFMMEEGLPLVREKRDRERKEREERRDDRKDERSSAGKNASTESSDKNKASGSSQDDDGKKKRTRVKTPVCTARNKVPRLSESDSQPTPSTSASTSTVSSSSTSTVAPPPPPQPPQQPQRSVDPEPAVVAPPPPSARPEVPAQPQPSTNASSVLTTTSNTNPATPRLFHAFVQIPDAFIEKDAERDRKIHELSEECTGLRKRMDELFSSQEKAERRTGKMKQDLDAQAAQFLHMSSRVNTVETRSVENAALAEPFKQEIQNLTNLHCAQMGALVARLSRTEQSLAVADQARQQVHARLDHAMTVLEQVWSELMNTRIYVHEEVNRPRDVSTVETMTDGGQLQLVTFPTVSHQSTASPAPPAPQQNAPVQQALQQEDARQQTAPKTVDAEMAAEALRLLGARNTHPSTPVNEQLMNTASTSSSMDVVSHSDDDRAGENGSNGVDKECVQSRESKLPVLVKRDSGEQDEEMAPTPHPAERTPVEKRPAPKSTVAEKKQTQSDKLTQSDAAASRQLFKKQKKDRKTPASLESLAVHSVVAPVLSPPVSATPSLPPPSPARHSSSSSAGGTGSGTAAVPSRLEQSAACPLPIRRIQKLEPIDDYETNTHDSPMSGQVSATASVTVVATPPPPSSLPLDQLESLIKRSPPSSPPPEDQTTVPLIEEPDDQPTQAALSSGWMPSLTSIAGGQTQSLQVVSTTTTVCSTSNGSSSSARPSDPRIAAKPSTIPANELFASQIQQLQQAVAIQQQMQVQALPVGRYADGSFYTPQLTKKSMGSSVMYATPTPSGRRTSSSSQEQSSSGMAGGGGGATGEWSQQQVQWMQHMQHLANQGYYWAQATPALLQQQQQYSFGSMLLQEPPPPPPPPPAQQPQLAIANESASPAPDGVVSGEEMTSLHPLVRLTITRPQ